ncbi:MAG TPA: hypothetical protein VNR36_02430 [Pseudolysinimonas sp.]|nr:hypothetical protein [Pseudolysinimonas sp.]
MTRLERGRELVAAARAAGVGLTLLGGAAVAELCESARTGRYARELGDVDLAGSSRDRSRIIVFAATAGLAPDDVFNGANSDIRLRFLDADDSHVDVFLDELRLCHAIRWGRHPGEGTTLPLPELLLTKTQVVQLEPKDVSDLSALLTDRWTEIRDARQRLTDLVRNDWGLWRTTRGTLEHLSTVGDAVVAEHAAEMLTHWNDIRFGPAARVRAAIGDRVRWYDEPEEI